MASTVPSDLDAEDITRLQFKPPQVISNAPPAPGSRTKIKGYFNPNQWPVHISNNATGLSLTLNNRNEYIVNAEGRKINDPILEQFVGANQLSREIGTEDIEYTLLPSRVLRESSSYGFAGVQTVSHTPGGNPIMPRAISAGPTPEASASPIGGMSMEEARKRRLIKTTARVEIDAGIEDREGGVDASRAPYLEVPVDRPRRTVVPDVEAQPENAQQAQLVRTLQENARTFNPDDITGLMRGDSLPAPVLEEEGDKPEPVVVVQAPVAVVATPVAAPVPIPPPAAVPVPRPVKAAKVPATEKKPRTRRPLL